MKGYTELAPYRQQFKEGVPMLMYHHVRRAPWRTALPMMYVPPALFSRQMEELKAAGFESAPPAAEDQKGSRPRFHLSFDDGFRNVLANAAPVLERTGFRGIQYLVPKQIGKTNAWDMGANCQEPLMDRKEIRDWLAAGQWIGAHTMTHPRLTRIPVAQAREEIQASRKALEDMFGVEVKHFAYPYGDWNEQVANLVGEAGFATACTTVFGINTAGTPPFQLARLTSRYANRGWDRLQGAVARRLWRIGNGKACRFPRESNDNPSDQK